MTMTDKDIYRAICGVTADKQPKTSIQIEVKIVDIDTENEKMIGEMVLDRPVVNICRDNRHTMVDLIFDSNTDYDYIQTFEMLKNASTVEHSMTDDDNSKLFIIQMTLLPNEFSNYFAAGFHACWVVTASDVNRLPDTVRFIFDNVDFHTYKIDENTVDTEIDDEINENIGNDDNDDNDDNDEEDE